MVVMFSELWSFMAVLVFILCGFSLMFMEFDKNATFVERLFSTYFAMFGRPIMTETMFQDFLVGFILFMLNIFLMNMLIAHMMGSHARVQEQAILADAKERIDLIIDAIIMKRFFDPKGREVGKKEYLIFCEENKEEDDFSMEEELTRRIKDMIQDMKTSMLSQGNGNKREMKALEEKIAVMDGNMRNMDENMKKMDEKMNSILSILKDKKSSE